MDDMPSVYPSLDAMPANAHADSSGALATNTVGRVVGRPPFRYFRLELEGLGRRGRFVLPQISYGLYMGSCKKQQKGLFQNKTNSTAGDRE